uniref:Uncharacterized protein n=1 Tax=Avena sativa TaxID=4498 RepID=A0ACD5WMG6_AVESA
MQKVHIADKLQSFPARYIVLFVVARSRSVEMAGHHRAAASMFAVALALGVLAAIPAAVQSIGVGYGVNGDNLPSASEVVQLYQSNRISGMRIYNVNDEILQALSGSNIDLLIDTGNDQLSFLAASAANADSWVQANIQSHKGLNIKYIAVGNENLFDAFVDTTYSALESAGAGSVGIVVSESGWPSAGDPAATTENAQTYNQNLINHVGLGTPKRSGAIETYIFAMFNEDKKTGLETERHFGLFNPDKSPAYPITF